MSVLRHRAAPPHREGSEDVEDDLGSGLANLPPELWARLRPLIEGEPAAEPGPVVLDRTERPMSHHFSLRTIVRPHAGAFGLAMLLVAVETVAVQAGPLLVQRAIDRGVVPGDLRVVAVTASLFVAAVVLGYLTSSVRLWWTGRLGQRLMEQLRVRVFTQLQRLSQAFFSEERVGRLLTRMTSDIEALSQLLQDGIVNLVVQGATLAFVTGILFWMNPRLATIVVVAVVPVMTAATLWFRRESHVAYTTLRERIAEVLTDLQENLAGARIVTASNRQDHNATAHREVVARHRDAELRVAHIQGVYGPGVDAIGAVGQVVILLVGGRMVLSGSLTVGQLTAFVLYLTHFFQPIQQLVNLYNTYQSGRAAIDKLSDLLAETPTVADAEDAEELPEVTGDIRFEELTFAYRQGQPILHDINLSIREGETVALVGETGAGKSTLAKLLTRTFDPQRGRVLVDGHDIRRVSIDSLRRQIGVVPQEPYLFSGTLRDNLTVGRPDAPDDEVVARCTELGLAGLLERLGGLDGRIAERGQKLSAGERQLIALARTLLRGPRLLVLDEATSNLDLRSELAVQRALDIALDGRTAIIVAHRLSTAQRADRVIVMVDGRIVEDGHHTELMARRGHYATMFETWETTAA